jgi:hypothetical protein
MNAAMSCVSSRLSDKFGMDACGNSRNETIMSDVTPGLPAMAANEGTLLRLPETTGPVAWHSEHHRSANRRPFSAFCATAAPIDPNRISATMGYNSAAGPARGRCRPSSAAVILCPSTNGLQTLHSLAREVKPKRRAASLPWIKAHRACKNARLVTDPNPCETRSRPSNRSSAPSPP